MVGTIQIHAAQCGPDSDSIEALAELLDKAENEIANVKDNFRSDYNALMDEVRRGPWQRALAQHCLRTLGLSEGLACPLPGAH